MLVDNGISSGGVSCIRFSRDDSLLFTAGEDGCLIIFEILSCDVPDSSPIFSSLLSSAHDPPSALIPATALPLPSSASTLLLRKTRDSGISTGFEASGLPWSDEILITKENLMKLFADVSGLEKKLDKDSVDLSLGLKKNSLEHHVCCSGSTLY